MSGNIMEQLNNPKNWKRTSKKNYEVYVCMPEIGTKASNKLEGAKYIVDENQRFKISGTVGEEWLIDVNKLSRTYVMLDGSPITEELLNKKVQHGVIDWFKVKTAPGGGAINWAFHLPLSVKNFPVKTSWGAELLANRIGVEHGVGDFILASDAGGFPNLNDVWVVNGEVFPNTYDMRAFPGLIPADKRKEQGEIPVPKSLLKRDEFGDVKEKDASRRIQYQIVGRYMDGSEITGYHLHSIDTGKEGKYTKSQVCFLVGRGQITNCTAQLYKDTVLLRGNGMSLEDLPVIREDGELRNADGLGKVRKGTSATDAVTMFNIVGTIKSGRNTVGYVIQNAGCGIKKVKRAQVIQLAQQGKIGNARVQNYNGNLILRGINVNLDELPSEVIGGNVVSQQVNDDNVDSSTPNRGPALSQPFTPTLH